MEELFNAVAQRAQGTPYEVIRTDDGFDVRLNLADSRFFGLLDAQGVTTAFTHSVRVQDPSAKTFTVTDKHTAVRWSAGVDGQLVPTATGSMQTVRGKSWSMGAEQQWAIRPDGTFGKVVDYRFDSTEGHGLITAAATSVGWTEKLNGWAKGAIYVALGSVAIPLLVVVIVLLIVKAN